MLITVINSSCAVSSDDGYRVFVDKLYPRGISKEHFTVDYWAKEITPSTELREWYHQDKQANWPEFAERYNQELINDEAFADFLKRIEQYKTITLVTDVKDVTHSHIPILKSYIEHHLSAK